LDSNDYALQGCADALENFFDSVWKKARKIEEIKSN
jgi:hypothetical protein